MADNTASGWLVVVSEVELHPAKNDKIIIKTNTMDQWWVVMLDGVAIVISGGLYILFNGTLLRTNGKGMGVVGGHQNNKG